MSSPAPALDPKHTALLVMDFQQGIVQRMPGLEPLLERVHQAIADMRDHSGTIAYVHHEDPSTPIHHSLAPQPGDIEVRKIRAGGHVHHRPGPAAARPRHTVAFRTLLRGTGSR
jgi:nicotinamidase-related amidase